MRSDAGRAQKSAKELSVKFANNQVRGIPNPCNSAGQAEESKPAPGQKVKKESPAESPRESPGIPADSPKRVKNEHPKSKKTSES